MVEQLVVVIIFLLRRCPRRSSSPFLLEPAFLMFCRLYCWLLTSCNRVVAGPPCSWRWCLSHVICRTTGDISPIPQPLPNQPTPVTSLLLSRNRHLPCFHHASRHLVSVFWHCEQDCHGAASAPGDRVWSPLLVTLWAQRDAMKKGSSDISAVMPSPAYKAIALSIHRARSNINQANSQARQKRKIQTSESKVLSVSDELRVMSDQATASVSELRLLRAELQRSQLSHQAALAACEQQRLQADKDRLTASNDRQGELEDTQARWEEASLGHALLTRELEQVHSQIAVLRLQAAAAADPPVSTTPSSSNPFPYLASQSRTIQTPNP